MFAARRCETAEYKTCKCRCGGALHGVKRGTEAQFFEGLPEEDPHFALESKRKKIAAMNEKLPWQEAGNA